LSQGYFRQGRPTIVEYLAGGLLGNVPLILVLFALSFSDPQILNTMLLTVQVTIVASLAIGAAVAAFYVAVGVQSQHTFRVIVVGVVTGGFCYLINMALSLFLFPWLPLGDYVKILAFLPAGAIGAFVRTRKKRTIRRPPSS